jgi:hypothetical protein
MAQIMDRFSSVSSEIADCVRTLPVHLSNFATSKHSLHFSSWPICLKSGTGAMIRPFEYFEVNYNPKLYKDSLM